LDQVRAELSGVHPALQRANDEGVTLRAELSAARALAAERAEEAEAAQAAAAASERQLGATQGDILTAQAEAEQLRLKTEDLEREVDQLRSVSSQLIMAQEEVARLQLAVQAPPIASELEERIGTLQAELAEARASTTAVENSAVAAREEAERLGAEVRQLRAQQDGKAGEEATAQQQLREAQESWEEEKTKYVSYIEGWKAHVEALTAAQAGMAAEVEEAREAKAENAELIGHIQGWKQRAEAIEAELHRVQQEGPAAASGGDNGSSQRLAAVEKELNRWKKQCGVLKTQLDMLRSAATAGTEQEEAVAQLMTELEAEKEEVARLRAGVSAARLVARPSGNLTPPAEWVD